MDMQVMQEIAKLFVYAIFVESIVEIVKVFSVKTLWDACIGIFKQQELTVDQIKLLTFLVAGLGCFLGDYGVISRVIEFGENIKSGVAYYDFIGTAAVVSRGSGLIYDKFEDWRAKWGKSAEVKQ